ncbi:MAG TPA: DUF2231 domain-containing protein [Burkholderiaceae bacterium]|nr:DUF2231 domain-containing protein [Burkholderiaceae bacterium]
MQTKVRLLGHSVHQMLVVFPLGLLGASVAFDVLRWITGLVQMSLVSYYLIAAGLIGGVIAAPFGLADWLAIPRETRARRVGALHGSGNAVVLALFFASWWLRRSAPDAPAALALACSFAGAALSLVTGWLGGELVDRMGVGVDDGANLDAPSSLSRPQAQLRRGH